ncbi:MAG: hypothetical protein QOH97_1021 [Actinoplanes sp.]|jgi:hypothetical protein|nr:hypothetical protein [Actinoplanes sp.]
MFGLVARPGPTTGLPWSIVLAGRGRAFRSLQKVIVRQGGYHVLFGSALAVAAVLLRWSQLTGVAVPQLAREHIR